MRTLAFVGAVALFLAAVSGIASAQSPVAAPVAAPVATPAQIQLQYNGNFSTLPINYPAPVTVDWLVLGLIFVAVAGIVQSFPAHLYGDSKTKQASSPWYIQAATNSYGLRAFADIVSEYVVFLSFVPLLFAVYLCFSSDYLQSFALFDNNYTLNSLLWSTVFLSLAGVVAHSLWYQNIGACKTPTRAAWLVVLPLVFAGFSFAVSVAFYILLKDAGVDVFVTPMTSLLSCTIISAAGLVGYVGSALAYSNL